MNVETIARVCHEANAAYCRSLGDMSQPSWEDAPDWQKASAVNGVSYIVENPDATPEDSHKSWLSQKRMEGWSYGPVKDAAKKEHPCFLDYDQLPQAQRSKDYIFGAIVRALADA